MQTERRIYIKIPERRRRTLPASAESCMFRTAALTAGDGGRGGDLIFEVDEGLNTLGDYRHKRKYAAGDGEPGGKRRCHGKDGKDLVLPVPEGTVIKEAVTGKVIADMSGDNRRQIVLKGGKGGLGNQHFATATMQGARNTPSRDSRQKNWKSS